MPAGRMGPQRVGGIAGAEHQSLGRLIERRLQHQAVQLVDQRGQREQGSPRIHRQRRLGVLPVRITGRCDLLEGRCVLQSSRA